MDRVIRTFDPRLGIDDCGPGKLRCVAISIGGGRHDSNRCRKTGHRGGIEYTEHCGREISSHKALVERTHGLVIRIIGVGAAAQIRRPLPPVPTRPGGQFGAVVQEVSQEELGRNPVGRMRCPRGDVIGDPKFVDQATAVADNECVENFGGVLQVVGTGVVVGIRNGPEVLVIQRDSVGQLDRASGQVNPQCPVREDCVLRDRVSGPRVDPHAVLLVVMDAVVLKGVA